MGGRSVSGSYRWNQIYRRHLIDLVLQRRFPHSLPPAPRRSRKRGLGIVLLIPNPRLYLHRTIRVTSDIGRRLLGLVNVGAYLTINAFARPGIFLASSKQARSVGGANFQEGNLRLRAPRGRLSDSSLRVVSCALWWMHKKCAYLWMLAISVTLIITCLKSRQKDRVVIH